MNCQLCNKELEEKEEITIFSAFLPPNHRFGRFSGVSFHKACFDADSDAGDVTDMYYVYEKIMASGESLQDWPPENGVVIYTSLDEDGDWFWADKDSWEGFERAEAAANKEAKERMEESYRQDREALEYVRDYDY